MKRTFTKLISLMLIVTMSATILCSCGKKYDVIYINDDSGEIAQGFNENMMSFHMSMEKTTLLAQFGMQEDQPEIWNITLNDLLGGNATDDVSDMTFGEYNDKLALDSAKKMVAASYLYDIMKDDDTVEGKVVAASAAKMDAEVDKIVSELQISVGSKENFESFIGGAGITMEDFRKYYEMNYRTTELRNAVYVSEDDKKDYFGEKYAIVKHILINTASKTNEAGEKVSLTAEELDAKKAEVRAIEARLSAGEEFETIFSEYDGADPGTAIYSEGYFVTDNGKFVDAFQNAALDMKEGEVRTVETEYGIHIMKKYPMDKEKYKLYSDINSEITTVLTSAAYTKMLEPYIEKVEVNSDAVAKYSMATVSMLKP